MNVLAPLTFLYFLVFWERLAVQSRMAGSAGGDLAASASKAASL